LQPASRGVPLDPFPKTLKWLEHGRPSAFPVAAGVAAGRLLFASRVCEGCLRGQLYPEGGQPCVVNASSSINTTPRIAGRPVATMRSRRPLSPWLPKLDSTLNNLHSPITESGAVVTHDPRPTIFGDGAQLLQVFQNLIQNAIKFRSNLPSQIHVSAAKTDTEWTFPLRITVSGSNPGFRSDFRDISAVT
jgi:signal transduction histidine kinase